MFVAVLSLSILLISTTPRALAMLQPSGIQTLLRISTALESVGHQEADSKLSSKQVFILETGHGVNTKRSDDYSPYTSNPYDAGPIDMCSYPQVDVCDFPSGYTVP